MATNGSAPSGISISDLLDAGLHFGHQTKRWNPKMKRYIFDKRNGVHIIDLSKSMTLMEDALDFIYDVASSGKSILMVGTKKQAQAVVKEKAIERGQHYVTHRWLGGTLTNSATIQRSIKRMRALEEMEKNNSFGTMHKKEASKARRELEKLRRDLGGIANMQELPGALFVVDITREKIAVAEARTLNIPVVAIVDTCCDPDPIDYVIPGNDDAIRAIKLVTEAVAGSIQLGTAEYARVAAELAKQKEEEEKARKAAEEARKAEAAKKKAEKEKAAKEAAANGEKADKPRKTTKKKADKEAPAEKAATKKTEVSEETAKDTPAKPEKEEKAPEPVAEATEDKAEAPVEETETTNEEK